MAINLPPIHDVTFGDSRIGSAIFAGDGRLYADVVRDALNLWNIAVFYWPEVLGALLGLVILCVLLAVRRVWNAQRTPGQWYCRRCNYCLSGLATGARCAECGADPARRRPVRGRSLVRRLAPALGVALVASAGYTYLHISGTPRALNRAVNLFHWEAPELMRWANDNRVRWLIRFRRPESVLMEIDPASGNIVRRVCTLPAFAGFTVSVGPGGKYAVAPLSRGELAAIDLSTGRVVRRAPRPDGKAGPGSPYGTTCWRHAAGWLDADTVCVQFFDAAAKTNTLYKWSIATGALEELADIPVPPPRPPTFNGKPVKGTRSSLPAGTPQPAPPDPARLMYLVPGSLLAFEVPDSHNEGGPQVGVDKAIRVRDLGAGGKVVREIAGRFFSKSAPVSLADGSAFYIGSEGGIMRLSMKDDECAEFKVNGFRGTLQDGPAGIAYQDATRRLFVATTSPHAVHVRDVASGRWIATLGFGVEALPDDRIALSPDGRWLAIQASEVLGNVTALPSNPAAARPFSITHHMFIFDLDKLPAPRPGEAKDPPAR